MLGPVISNLVIMVSIPVHSISLIFQGSLFDFSIFDALELPFGVFSLVLAEYVFFRSYNELNVFFLLFLKWGTNPLCAVFLPITKSEDELYLRIV